MIEASSWSPHWTVGECAPQASERWGKVGCRHSHTWARLGRHEYDVTAWLARVGGRGGGGGALESASGGVKRAMRCRGCKVCKCQGSRMGWGHERGVE